MVDRHPYADDENSKQELNNTVAKIFDDIHNHLKVQDINWGSLKESLTILIDKPEVSLETKLALENITLLARISIQLSLANTRLENIQALIKRK